MAFCGRCGLLLNADVQKCPRCNTATDFDAIGPGTPTNTNEATFIAYADKTKGETPYTPAPTSSPSYPGQSHAHYAAAGETELAYPQNHPNYPTERASSPGYTPQSDSSYPPYGAPGYPTQSGGNYPVPGALPPGYNPQSGGNYAGNSQPGFYPNTNPGYPPQPPVPPRKQHTWLFVLGILLVLLLGAGTVSLFILGPTHFPQFFGGSTATATTIPTTQPTATAQPQDTPTTQPTPTSQPSPTPQPTQQAQAALQQYFTDINNKDYQSAYNIWANNPQTYTQFQQGFAHTRRDDITLGNTTIQNDGSIQVDITIQSTEDAASGTGTQVSTYQGYYVMQQQTDGSWKIATAKIQ